MGVTLIGTFDLGVKFKGGSLHIMQYAYLVGSFDDEGIQEGSFKSQLEIRPKGYRVLYSPSPKLTLFITIFCGCKFSGSKFIFEIHVMTNNSPTHMVHNPESSLSCRSLKVLPNTEHRSWVL